ncbi:hypothetical protein C8R45DRAFT_1015672 [Mycena sanguinolenta]|nr:hypothetical protein C8R45DRAFT_1015672 [Mycena sanguinolenta]
MEFSPANPVRIAMLNSKAALVCTLGVRLSSASAAPIYGNPTLKVCSRDPPTGLCVTVPLVSDIPCIDMIGGWSGLNKEISSATVPHCFVCKFFQDFGCSTFGVPNAGTVSEVVPDHGTWNFSSVPGLDGTTDFKDLTSSFTCVSSCGLRQCVAE